MDQGTRFTLTEEHRALMRNARIVWGGAPCFDSERPYGSTEVEWSICDLLGWPQIGERRAAARKLHSDMLIALEIVLVLQTFELGTYVKVGYRQWSRAGTVGS